MYVPLRIPSRGRRLFVGALLMFALFFNSVGTLFAGTTGTISGTITNTDSKLPLAGVAVNAISPTGRYNGTTDQKGFFAFNGVSPDTYTVSFELKGYQPTSVTGLTVFADQNASVTSTLQKSLQTIGKVTARSQGGAFQPTQAQDTYTVTTKQIKDILGKADSISETDLLTRLPGASLDKYGYPVLRGGRENEEGFQFDGIDYVDAFTSQFTNSLTLNPAVGQLQLTPGSGDASTGNSGTGTINLIAKRGSYPGFGSIDLEALLQPYDHQLAFEYGFATPDGHVSNYVSFLGSNSGRQNGARGSKASEFTAGTFYNYELVTSRDLIDNFVYKFGKNSRQSFQIFYDNQQTNFLGTYGGSQQYPTNDPLALAQLQNFTGLTTAQLQSPTIVSLLPNQASLTDPLLRGSNNGYQPNNVLKFQYTNNLSNSTFLSAKYYQLDAVTTFDDAENFGSVFLSEDYVLQGGHRTGGSIDLTSQLGTKQSLSFGAKYDFLHPVDNFQLPVDGVLVASGFGNGGYEVADFINPNNPNPDLANCPLGTDPNGASYCGYLFGTKLGAKPGPVPYFNQSPTMNRQDYAFYLRDKIAVSDRLNIDAGLRFDGTHYQLPGLDGCNPTTAAQALDDSCQYALTGFRNINGTTFPTTTIDNAQRSPLVVEPRFAFTYKIGNDNVFRASYGRSVQFAPLSFIDTRVPKGTYKAFAGIPSYDANANAIAGTPVDFTSGAFAAQICGVRGNLPCKDYQDQIYWENQSFNGVPIQPVKPETFNNYEFSLEHQFANNISVKVTPFYRRGYDALVLVSQPRFDKNGVPLVDAATGNIILGPATSTNLGSSRTTGVEFYLTREAAYGLSGQLALTYINEFSNVVPSPLIQEDFFPPVPTQSLALGNQYRVGFVSPLAGSLALAYKTHGGLRVNPIVTYRRGYPLGVGNITAAYVGGKPYNIPNTNTPQGSAFGSNLSPNFVDPQNPGTVFKPNIAATRGTAETASAGGILQSGRLNTDLGIEFNKPGSKSTVGVLFTNLFNQTYGSNPAYNSRYQPVATGISGPKTGYSNAPVNFPNEGLQQYLPSQFGQDPYRLIQNATPQTVRVYYQLAL